MQDRLWISLFLVLTGSGCDKTVVQAPYVPGPTDEASGGFTHMSAGDVSQRVGAGAIDSGGNMYLAGSQAGDVPAAFLTKLDRNANVQWQRIIDPQEGGFDEYSWSVVCDSQDRIYLGSLYALPRPARVYVPYYVRINEFNAAGDSLWEQHGAMGLFRNAQAMSGLAIDGQDNLYSATSFEDLDNYLITSFSPSGKKRFEAYFPNSRGTMSFKGISGRASGGLHAIYSIKTLWDPVPVVETINESGKSIASVDLPSSPYLVLSPFVVHDGFIVNTVIDQKWMFQKIDFSGASVWLSDSFDLGIWMYGPLAEDKIGNIYYAAISISDDLSICTLSLLKLNSAGILQWTQQRRTPHSLLPKLVLVDPLGQQVSVVGSTSSGSNPQYPASDPRSSGFEETFVARFENW